MFYYIYFYLRQYNLSFRRVKKNFLCDPSQQECLPYCLLSFKNVCRIVYGFSRMSAALSIVFQECLPYCLSIVFQECLPYCLLSNKISALFPIVLQDYLLSCQLYNNNFCRIVYLFIHKSVCLSVSCLTRMSAQDSERKFEDISRKHANLETEVIVNIIFRRISKSNFVSCKLLYISRSKDTARLPTLFN